MPERFWWSLEMNFKWQKLESHTSSSLCQAPDLASWKLIRGFSSLPPLFFDLLLLPLQKHILIPHLQSYHASLPVDVITWKHCFPGRMCFSHACPCATRQRHQEGFFPPRFGRGGISSVHTGAVTQPSLCVWPCAEAWLEMTCSLEQPWHLLRAHWGTWASGGCDLTVPFPEQRHTAAGVTCS